MKNIPVTLPRDFVAYDTEAEQLRAAEGSCYGAVGGVAASGHQNAADARDVVAGVERPPAVAKIHFEPGAEIHRAGSDDDANVAEIAGGIACRNI